MEDYWRMAISFSKRCSSFKGKRQPLPRAKRKKKGLLFLLSLDEVNFLSLFLFIKSIVKEINRINEKDIENAMNPNASWHGDYRDSRYIFVGGLDYRLTEGDVMIVFSQ